jgi:phosphoglycolate phosphatase-like HAD superfamily hydrolase
MSNVVIYVDVDLTLVDELQRLKPNAWEGLLTLREAGCRLILWSTNGGDYCRQIAERHEIAPLFEAFLPKPDLYIDDMPATFLNSGVLNVADAGDDWQALADRIVRDHVRVK